MDEAYDNFSCSDPLLNRTDITEEVWILGSNATEHEISVLVQAIIQTLFVAVGVPWNTIVLISILVEKLYKEPTYILLLNLVIADVLVYICVLPFNIQTAFAREFTIGNSDFVRCSVCQAVTVIILTLVYVSLFTLALMSIDRLIYIKWPLHYGKYVTVTRVLLPLSLVWVFCLVVSVLPLFGIGEIKFSDITSSCSLITRGRARLIENNNFVLVLGAVGLFPFSTVVICNIWIMIIIYRTVHGKYSQNIDLNKSVTTSKEEQRNTERKLRLKYQKQQIRLVQLFGALFVANFITWVPTLVIAIVSSSIGSHKIPYPLSTIQYLAYVSQPFIHPMLETCLIQKARTSIVHFLCFCCHKRKVNVTSPNSKEYMSRSTSVSSEKNYSSVSKTIHLQSTV